MNKNKGWFHTQDREGDRSLDQQLIGLEPLFEMVEGKTVLDVGCAEGLISMELARRGAKSVYGVEVVYSHIEIADALKGSLPVQFEHANANDWSPDRKFDIILMLGVLHKLRDPSTRCALFVRYAKSNVVIRLPPSGPVIIDSRSYSIPHDIRAMMVLNGFVEDAVTVGPLDEWVGYYRRVK